jgi:hypothetical protein
MTERRRPAKPAPLLGAGVAEVGLLAWLTVSYVAIPMLSLYDSALISDSRA